MIHEVKCQKLEFEDIIAGRRTFDFGLPKKDYQVGEMVAFNEWDQAYTGRSCLCYIDYTYYDECNTLIFGFKPCGVCRFDRPYNAASMLPDYRVPLATDGYVKKEGEEDGK